MFHMLQKDLPFGGVGPSGMGAYHGIEGFKRSAMQRVFIASQKDPCRKAGRLHATLRRRIREKH